MTESFDYPAKIAALREKAEKASTEAEADAFFEKAAKLMVKWQVTEEMVAAARGIKVVEKIVDERMTFTGIYHQAEYKIASRVAKASSCRPIINMGYGGKKTVLSIVGHESDVRQVILLSTSLQLQCATAMRRWWATTGRDECSWMSSMEQFKQRRQFIFSFASAVGGRLDRARREAAAETTAATVAEETGVAAAADAPTTGGGELVLVGRAARVDDWVDTTYGKLRRTGSNIQGGGYSASNAGAAAGRSASIGGASLRGGSAAIGR